MRKRNRGFKVLMCILAGITALSLGAGLDCANAEHPHAAGEHPHMEGEHLRMEGEETVLTEDGVKEIQLEAYQFGYSPDPIVVKKGDIVKIFASSRDVPHGFYIEEYGINASIEKGKVIKIEFIADRAGEFDIICSVYCGRGHSNMKAKLVVEE